MSVGDRVQITGGPHKGEQGVVTRVTGVSIRLHRDGTHPDSEYALNKCHLRVVNAAAAA